MKKTILPLCLLFSLSVPTALAETTAPLPGPSTIPVQTAPALSPAIEPTDPPPAQSITKKNKPLYKRALRSCSEFAKGTGRRVKRVILHPADSAKKTPAATFKVIKTCHEKALDFSDSHERDFRLIGNITTVAGAVFFVKGIAQKWNGTTTNKTVLIGQ